MTKTLILECQGQQKHATKHLAAKAVSTNTNVQRTTSEHTTFSYFLLITSWIQ